MKVFLSGKVDEQHGRWRDLLIGTKWADGQESPRWELAHKNTDLSDHPFADWPLQRGVVMRAHDYVGPYRQTIEADPSSNKNEGYFHGVASRGSHGQMDAYDQQTIVSACMRAIDTCDMFFAYLNTRDCFGTLCELGYARAKGKFIAVVANETLEEMWFGCLMSNFYCHLGHEDVTEKESLERAFLEAVSAFVARPSAGPDKSLAPLVFSHGR